MDDKSYKVVIVEGEDRELHIFNLINRFYFRNRIKFIMLPAEQNIYMLWNKLKEDKFETDVVEILRESNAEAKQILTGLTRDDIDEVYLFFDYDGHQKNLSPLSKMLPNEVIIEMLDNFNNETENGKLYISYPMVEAIRDFSSNTCQPWTKECVWDLKQGDKYKELSGDQNKNAQIEKFNIEKWREVFSAFLMRIGCLFDVGQIPKYSFYREEVEPRTIFYKQNKKYIKKDKVFILSAIPEFLLDYNKEKFWRGMIRNKKKLKPNGKCNK